MRTKSPPILASWLLKRCASDCDPSLRGDLLEEFHRGRGTGWYWRQTFRIVAITLGRQLPVCTLDVLFASAWCTLMPGWTRMIAAIEIYFDLAARLRATPFPVSNLLALALNLGSQLAFIWWGLALYLMLRVLLAPSMRVQCILRGLLWSAQVFIAATAAVAPLYFLVPRLGNSSHALTYLDNLVSVNGWIRRIPYALSFLCALWLLSHRSPGFRERSVS